MRFLAALLTVLCFGFAAQAQYRPLQPYRPVVNNYYARPFMVPPVYRPAVVYPYYNYPVYANPYYQTYPTYPYSFYNYGFQYQFQYRYGAWGLGW